MTETVPVAYCPTEGDRPTPERAVSWLFQPVSCAFSCYFPLFHIAFNGVRFARRF